MSYSFEEPDWAPVCDCRYDEARDEMDRDNCVLHCEMGEEASPREDQIARKNPVTKSRSTKENAA